MFVLLEKDTHGGVSVEEAYGPFKTKDAALKFIPVIDTGYTFAAYQVIEMVSPKGV
jgi:hypothetical protein